MSFIYSDVAQVSASRRIWHGFAGIHKSVAVLGTGEPGSRPGRHLFMSHGGRHEQLKKSSVPLRFSILYHFNSIIGNGAPACGEGAVHRSDIKGKGVS